MFFPGPFPWNLCERYRKASFALKTWPSSSIYSNLTFGLKPSFSLNSDVGPLKRSLLPNLSSSLKEEEIKNNF